MGKSSHKSKNRKKSFESDSDFDLSASSSSSQSQSESDSSSSDYRRRRSSSRSRDIRGSKHKKRHRSSKSSGRRDQDGKHEKKRKRRRKYSSDEDEPENIVKELLDEFPNVGSELQQLLEMIDNGQGVDVKGISDKLLVRHLKKLFSSLKLKRTGSGVYILPPRGHSTLQLIGPILCSYLKSSDNDISREQSLPSNPEHLMNDKDMDDTTLPESLVRPDSPTPRRRVIGPAMPSQELLAAAAELAEAETLLRDADVEADDGLLIGPPPPSMVAEVESANEAERFEEVARIAGAEAEKPYEVLGVNWKMSSDNIKKRYWKLSLMVHPDKCSHPQAHQAFVKLNQAFKDLKDPTKRNAIDEKIKVKEEQEAFKIELKELREAAKWRKTQGISMEGDEELLAVADEVTKEAPTRDEWMTALPPEKKAGGVSMQSRTFSKTTKEGRGDTSAWIDTPLDKAQKAKQNYLEAYNKTKAIAEAESSKKSADADLVDKYNSSKRSKSLVQKHQEEKQVKKKKPKHGLQSEKEKEEWIGQHPWKPWDRENDLTAGRKKVNLDSNGMAHGLTSRFSSGTVQRNFL